MTSDKQAQIRDALLRIAELYAATMDVVQTAMALITEEAALDPLTYWRTRGSSQTLYSFGDLSIDSGVFVVTFRGQPCFLGNTLPFRLLARLAQRPNSYLPNDRLLDDVWHCKRTKSAVKSVVKSLRIKLRVAGLTELAQAIDGSVYGHYALKLDSK